ncbi:Oxidoreductase [Lecanicillium sp. MT-2017a]|nr:Oxidoreductase [Lecanicillium sp. MT-2017a]
MYRTALRTASRPAAGCLRAQTLRAAPRRFASTTSPADKSRTWKASAFRWGLAAAAVYYYNTSTIFMDDGATAQTFTAPPTAFPETETKLPTVDSIVEERKMQAATKSEAPVDDNKTAEPKPAAKADKTEEQTTTNESQAAAGSPAALEEEAGQEGAFNPETGEINWDCPCLGGMAHGPCGEEFKTAFSCFVYSTEEPKGMDCIEKFQGMQECFRQYPEIYGAELADDEADDEIGQAALDASKEEQQAPVAPTGEPEIVPPETEVAQKEQGKPANVPAEPTEAKPESESKGPKWEDATAANVEVKEEEQKKKQE